VHPDWRDRDLVFEFWTSSMFDDEAITQNTKQYKIVYRDYRDVSRKIRDSKNKALIKTFMIVNQRRISILKAIQYVSVIFLDG